MFRHFLNVAFNSTRSFAARRSSWADFKSSIDAIAGMVTSKYRRAHPSCTPTSTCSVHCSSLHLSHLFFNKPLHFLFLRQFQLIFGNEELIIHSCKGVFDQRMLFLSA